MVRLKSILLVEDDPKDIELTLGSLEEYNLANEVLVARDGAEALDYLYRRGQFADYPNGNPAVILLDLKLPKVDGFEVLRTIRSDDRLKLIPVTILTSSREDNDLIQSYKLGVNAYIVKPVDFHQFTDAIKKRFIRNKVEKNLLRSLLIFNFKWLRALKLVKPHGLRIWERLTAQNSFKMDKYWAKKSAKPLLIRFCKSLITISLIKQGNISTVRFIST